MKGADDARLGVLRADVHGAAGDEQPGLAEEVAHPLLQLAGAVPVLKPLVGEDAFDRLLLGDGNVLADVLFGFLVHQQVPHQLLVCGQDHKQFVRLIGRLDDEHLFVSSMLVKRADHMDGQFVLPPVQPVVQLSGKGVVLTVVVIANLAVLDDLVENDLLEFGGNVRGLHVGILDLLFDVLLLVGQELVEFTVALHIGLLFEQAEGLLDLPAQRRQILVEAVQHEDAQVANRGLELLDVFDQEQGLEQANGERVVKVVLRLDDRLLNLGFQGGADAFEHQVKGRQLADGMVLDLHGHLLEHAQHGALAHRTVLALEGVVLRQVLDGRLEQAELVRNERVAVDEVLPVLEVPVGHRAVGKVEQGFEVVALLVIDGRQQAHAFLCLGQQPLLDDLRHVGAGQLHAIGKPRLDLGKVIALLFAHLADHGSHVFLGRDHDPGPAPALGGQAFGDGLEVGHQLDVFGDVLADLVNKEVQPEIRGLPLDIGMDLLGEVLDGDAVLAAVFLEDARGRGLILTGCPGVGAGDVLSFQQGLLAAC